MILTEQQARLASGIAEASPDGKVAIDNEDRRGIYPSVDMAVRANEGVYGRRPDGWKVYVVEPSGRATLRS